MQGEIAYYLVVKWCDLLSMSWWYHFRWFIHFRMKKKTSKLGELLLQNAAGRWIGRLNVGLARQKKTIDCTEKKALPVFFGQCNNMYGILASASSNSAEQTMIPSYLWTASVEFLHFCIKHKDILAAAAATAVASSKRWHLVALGCEDARAMIRHDVESEEEIESTWAVSAFSVSLLPN